MPAKQEESAVDGMSAQSMQQQQLVADLQSHIRNGTLTPVQASAVGGTAGLAPRTGVYRLSAGTVVITHTISVLAAGLATLHTFLAA